MDGALVGLSECGVDVISVSLMLLDGAERAVPYGKAAVIHNSSCVRNKKWVTDRNYPCRVRVWRKSSEDLKM
ncbi:hypothetical protein E5288_WYG014214 [Bos mutus]|uniref:Uncharacterized protein n=1 Tax=Bos mutus TaxID=72004 RepID=A0A6B0R222_9CETA|nr:hypothetical protein [Bos mutus]